MENGNHSDTLIVQTLALLERETCTCGKAVQRARASLSVFERSQRLNQLLPVQADRVRAPRAMERGAKEREEALTPAPAPVNDKSRERDRVLALPCPAPHSPSHNPYLQLQPQFSFVGVASKPSIVIGQRLLQAGGGWVPFPSPLPSSPSFGGE